MAKVSDALSGEAVSVRELFTTADRRLKAPEFQRTYVWRTTGSNAQIPRFWADLEALRDEGGTDDNSRDSLFLGALVLQIVEPARGAQVPLNSIIDGQQRILTIYLTLTAIAEAFQRIGNTDEAEAIESEYLLVELAATRTDLVSNRHSLTLDSFARSCRVSSTRVRSSPILGTDRTHIIYSPRERDLRSGAEALFAARRPIKPAARRTQGRHC